jgi:tRNA 2-thiouridine synthesizing protein E
MIADKEGYTVATDEEGYLVDPAHWDEHVAQQLAWQEQLDLNEEHWQVFRFMRAYYAEHQIAPDARFAIKFLADELGYGRKAQNHLFKLFPYGYVKQACKIAGMKRPRAWSTG